MMWLNFNLALIISEGQSTETSHGKDPKTEQQGKKIHIDVKSHYKTFNQTTLPHVLTEYGLEDKTHSRQKKVSTCVYNIWFLKFSVNIRKTCP